MRKSIFLLLFFIFVFNSCSDNKNDFDNIVCYVTSQTDFFEAINNIYCTEIFILDGIYNIGYINIPCNVKLLHGTNKAKIIGSLYIKNNDNLFLENIVLDCSDYLEGFIIEDSNNLYIENISINGNPNNHHSMLIENCQNVIIKDVVINNSYQGLAVKCVDFNIERLTTYNCFPWGLTVRYSPYAYCENGSLQNINIYGGGISLMNDEEGCELNNIHIENIMIYDGVLYFINNNNETSMHNINIEDICFLDCQRDYNIQFFGVPKDVTIENAKFFNCIQPIYTNNGYPIQLNFINFSYINSGITSILEGEDIYCEGFKTDKKKGYFIDNRSKNLKIKDFQDNIKIVNNLGGNYLIIE